MQERKWLILNHKPLTTELADTFQGAIHKRRQNILGGEGGLKFRCCKILEGKG